MTEKRPNTVGAFLGLITSKGRVRYQMRIENDLIAGISYKGDFELPGGRVRKKDLRVVLTPDELFKAAAKRTKEEMGITVAVPDNIMIYRTIFENYTTEKIDWAFMIPILPKYWDETAEVKRKIVDLDPDDLDVLERLNLIFSGKKRMYRMGLAAMYLGCNNSMWHGRPEELLNMAMPGWKEIECLYSGESALADIRKELGLE